MSQTIFSSINPGVTSGNQLAQILNDFKDAYVSGNSGTSRPDTLQAGGYWVDTTNDAGGTWGYKIYDGTSDILIFTINKNTGSATIGSADSLFSISKVSADNVGPILNLIKKRIANAGQVVIGDSLGDFQFQGTTNGGAISTTARIRAVANDNYTSTARGSYLTIEVTAVGTTAPVEVVRVIDGKVGVGIGAPVDTLHVRGSGIRSERNADDAVGAKGFYKKKRLAGNGQVLANDIVGEIGFLTADDNGNEREAAKFEVSARENVTSTAQGSKIVFKNKKTGQTAYTDQIIIEERVSIPELIGTNFYFGAADTDGSFRFTLSAGSLLIQKRIAGVWTNRDEIQ